jgi:deoxyribonuclease-4
MRSRSPHACRRLLGAHMSIAGGLATACERGGALGCTAIQIFTKNAAQWRARPLEAEATAAFAAARARHRIRFAMAHASYLLNLAAPRRALWRASVGALVEELARCSLLELPFLVVHPGCHMGAGETDGVRRVAGAVNEALARPETRQASVLLEGTAGQGTAVGWRFEQLAALLEEIRPSERCGICLDTCHLFAAGYDLRSEVAYARTMDEFDRVVGLARLRAIHANDCRCDLGGRVDRHAHIGEGRIGIDGFRLLMSDGRLAHLPVIIETPKSPDGMAADRRNLARLRRLVSCTLDT